MKNQNQESPQCNVGPILNTILVSAIISNLNQLKELCQKVKTTPRNVHLIFMQSNSQVLHSHSQRIKIKGRGPTGFYLQLNTETGKELKITLLIGFPTLQEMNMKSHLNSTDGAHKKNPSTKSTLRRALIL